MTDINTQLEKQHTDFIKLLIESTGLYHVDNNLIIKDIDNNEVKFKDSNKPLKLLTNPLDNNAIIINPINETIKEDKSTIWFYTTLSMSITMKIKQMITYLIDMIPIQDKLSIKELKSLSKYLELLDDKKSISEINTIFEDYIAFANIVYNKRLKKSYFRTGIFEESFIEKFKKIRKKTIKFIDKFICDLFEIDSEQEIDIKNEIIRKKFEYHTNEITCPKFICYINTYIKVLHYINIMIDNLGMDQFIVDLSLFDDHLKNINKYYKISKWASSTITISSDENQSFITNSSNTINTSVNNQSLLPTVSSNVNDSAITGGALPGMTNNVLTPSINIPIQPNQFNQPFSNQSSNILLPGQNSNNYYNPEINNIFQQQSSPLFSNNIFNNKLF